MPIKQPDQIAANILQNGDPVWLFPNCMIAIDECLDTFKRTRPEAYRITEEAKAGSTILMLAFAVGVQVGRNEPLAADRLAGEFQGTVLRTAIDAAALVIASLHKAQRS